MSMRVEIVGLLSALLLLTACAVPVERIRDQQISFTGAKVMDGKLIPEPGFALEPSDDPKVVFLRRQGKTTGEVSCDCALEGGGCDPVIFKPGDIDEHLACVPAEGCGSSGLFCFMELNVVSGARFQFRP